MNVLDLVAKLSLDSTGYESGLSKAKSVASTAGSMIASAIGLATTAVAGFAAASVKTGADFDKSMSQVAATMGITSSQLNATEEDLANMTDAEREATLSAQENFGALRDYAQEMGRTTAFSATEAAEALNYMALAGYDAETSMAMLPNVLNLAAAGDMELARASDMVTDSATAMGMVLEDGSVDMERVTQMIDEMAKAASTGNTNVEQLGDAFLTVGGLAKELNGGFVYLEDGTEVAVDGVQELEIALTAMANAGIKGSEAGTHMRNMLLKLSSPTKEGVEALEAMGVTVYDTEGNMRSLADIFVDLGNAMGNMTQEDKIKTISELFNTRDIASAEALLAAVESDWDAIGASIVDAEGAASAMAEMQLNNLAGDVTLWKSALEGTKIAISDQLTPSLREFVQFGTSGLSDITAAFQEGGLTGAIDAFSTVLSDGLNMITKKLPSFINAGMSLLGALGQGIINNIPTIVDSAVVIVEKLAQGFVKALPALAKGAVTLITSLKDSFKKNSSQLLSVGSELLTMLWTGITEGLPMLVEGITTLMSDIATYLQEALPQLLPVALEALMQFSESLRENAGILVDSALNLIMTLAQGLIDSLPAMIQTIPTIVSNIAGIINDNAPKLIATGIELIGKLAMGIVEAGPTLLQEFPKIVKAIWDVIAAINWINLGSSIITGIKDGVTSLASEIPTKLKEIGQQALEFIKGIDWKLLGSNIITFIKTGMNALITDIPTLLKNIGTTAVEWLSGIDWLQLGKDLINLIVDGIKYLVKSIPDALVAIGNSAVTAFLEIDWAGLGGDIIDGIVQGVKDMASAFMDVIEDLCKDAWEAVKSFFGISSPSKLMRYAGQMLDKGFALGITKNIGVVKDAIDELNSTVSVDDIQASSYFGGYKTGEEDYSKATFTQVNNIYSPEQLDPSEIARQTRNATRDMVLEFRGIK